MNTSKSKYLAPTRRLLCCAAAALLSGPALAASASSTFDSNADGWTVLDESGSGSIAPTWESSGYISATDTHGWVSFGAPTKFLGNLLGQKLSFDLYSRSHAAQADTFFTVLIASGATTLYWYGGVPSTTGFSSFTVNLDGPTAEWRNGGGGYRTGGTAVTQETFASVLSNVTRLQIDADWQLGEDYVRLDNVSISAVPEPETYAMLLAGLGLMGGITRRGKRT